MSLLSNLPSVMMSAGEWDDFRVQIASIWLSRSWLCGDDRDGLISRVLGWVILTKRGSWMSSDCMMGVLVAEMLHFSRLGARACYKADPWMTLDGLQSWHWLYLCYITVCHWMWWNREKGRRLKRESWGRWEKSKAICDKRFVLSLLGEMILLMRLTIKYFQAGKIVFLNV